MTEIATLGAPSSQENKAHDLSMFKLPLPVRYGNPRAPRNKQQQLLKPPKPSPMNHRPAPSSDTVRKPRLKTILCPQIKGGVQFVMPGNVTFTRIQDRMGAFERNLVLAALLDEP